MGDVKGSGVCGRGRVDGSCGTERPDGLQGRSENSGNSNDENPSKSFQRAARRAGNPGSQGNYHLETIVGHPCLKYRSAVQCGRTVWSVCSEQTNNISSIDTYASVYIFYVHLSMIYT